MKLSVFRPKGNTPTSSPRRTSRFSQMLSQTRSTKSNSSQDQLPPDSLSLPDGDSRSESNNAEKQDLDLPPLPSSTGVDDSPIPHAKRVTVPQSGRSVATSDAMDEQEMARKLMDVESSFLPESVPPAHDQTTSENARTTDSSQGISTHVSRARAPNGLINQPPFPAPNSTEKLSNDQVASPTEPQVYSRDPFVPGDDDEDGDFEEAEQRNPEYSSSMPVQDDSLSSPSAAAVHRSLKRDQPKSAISSNLHSSAPDSNNISTSDTLREADRPSVPSYSSNPQEQEQLHSSSRNVQDSNDVGERNSDLETSNSNNQEKPSAHLKQNQSSQRSSLSSFTSHEARSDVAQLKDRGHRSRATMTGSMSTVRKSQELSRVPSLGSMASSLSEDGDHRGFNDQKRSYGAYLAPVAKPSLERVDEHTPVKLQPFNRDRDADATPIASSYRLQEPSDTVLAKHVKDVKVPDTIARKYRTANQPNLPEPSPARSLMATPSFGRGKTNLTLKEQNGRIDKLSKENFDLKLKIHYLYQALQDRSDEGVKDLISKNAQLQADLVKSKKELQSLRRRIKDLEHPKKSPLPSHVTEDETEDELSSRGFNQTQMEEEILYLRDRMQQLEHERDLLERGQALGGIDANEDAEAALYEERAVRQKCEREIRDLRIEISRLNGDPTPLRNLKQQRSLRGVEAGTLSYENEQDESVGASDVTLVEQLRQENAVLRRDLGAQMSMLTSHTRERDRLQQEIEDLKLGQRQSDLLSAQPDEYYDLSDSRSPQRPLSFADGSSRGRVSDMDREYYENVQANLRDENAHLRMRNQDLLRDLDNLKDSTDILQLVETERDEAAQALREADADVDYLTEAVKELEDSIALKEEQVSKLEMELRRREQESDIFQGEIKSIGDSLNRLVEDSELSQITIQNLQQDLVNANGELETMETNLREALSVRERLEVQAESSKSMIAFLRDEQESDKIKISDLETTLRNARTDQKTGKDHAEVFNELENGMASAKEESRQLRKALATKELEATNSQMMLEELESGLRRAFGSFDASGIQLLTDLRKLQSDLESTSEELEGTRHGLADLERKVKERDILLESSALETRRLSDLLDRERQARKHDYNEYDRARRRSARSKPDERIIELEDEARRGQRKVEQLEQHFSSQLHERNVLLLTLWTRLSSLCGSEWLSKWRLTDEHGNALTAEKLPQHTTHFNQGILSAVQHLESTISGLETDVRSKADDIWKDVRVLEHNLNSRVKRLDKVEKALAHHRYGAGAELAVALKDLSRAKEDNRRLRKEVKFLKEGSFALPGLPSPKRREGDRDDRKSERGSHRDTNPKVSAENLFRSASANGPTPTRLAQDDQNSHRSGTYGSFRHYSENNAGRSLLAPQLTASGDESGGGGSNSSLRHDDSDNNQEGSINYYPETSLVAQKKRLASPAGSSDAIGRSHQGSQSQYLPNSLSQREQTWVLRLEELKRALNTEREARLLDREGARQRLEEGQLENKDLRAALLRERSRKQKESFQSGARTGPSMTGGAVPNGASTGTAPADNHDID